MGGISPSFWFTVDDLYPHILDVSCTTKTRRNAKIIWLEIVCLLACFVSRAPSLAVLRRSSITTEQILLEGRLQYCTCVHVLARFGLDKSPRWV
jgi:hypothetical protein